jgi:hypothetical protein
MGYRKLSSLTALFGFLLLCLCSVVTAEPNKIKCPTRNDYTDDTIKSFKKDSNFRWDGSKPIGFPEFTGEIPFPTSTHAWNGDAKKFALKSMSLLPPAIRDNVKDYIIKACDEIANKDGASEISVNIVSKAFTELARGCRMPENVLNNLPQSMDDLNKPRVPLDCNKDLKPQYCPPRH